MYLRQKLNGILSSQKSSQLLNPELNPTDVKIKAGFQPKTGNFPKNTTVTSDITTSKAVDNIKVYYNDTIIYSTNEETGNAVYKDAGDEVPLTSLTSKISDDSKVWTVKFKASKAVVVPRDSLYIVAYDSDGNYSDKWSFANTLYEGV